MGIMKYPRECICIQIYEDSTTKFSPIILLTFTLNTVSVIPTSLNPLDLVPNTVFILDLNWVLILSKLLQPTHSIIFEWYDIVVIYLLHPNHSTIFDISDNVMI